MMIKIHAVIGLIIGEGMPVMVELNSGFLLKGMLSLGMLI